MPTVAEEAVRCAGPGPTWSSTGPGPVTAWASSCCGTAGCGGAGTTGRLKHQAWLGQQRFEERALNETLAHYQVTLTAREVRPGALR